MFDRSGPYSSTVFDIHKEPERFIHTITAYMMINDKKLGLDTFIKQDNRDWFITIVEDATGKKKRLQLELVPITY